MTNEELHVLAAAGLRERIATMQAELTVYHDEFPELFASPTPPQLLKVPTNGNGHGNNNGNGHRAATTAATTDTATDTAPVRRRRTMSRKARAAISAAQKARWAKQKAAKRNG